MGAATPRYCTGPCRDLLRQRILLGANCVAIDRFSVYACGVPEVGRASYLRRSKIEPQGMIVSPVVPSPLPDLHPAARLADTAQSRIVVQGRRDPDPAPRGRGTTQNQPKRPPGLGRPSRVRRADPTPTDELARTPPDHPGHGPALASPPGDQKVDLVGAENSVTSCDLHDTRVRGRRGGLVVAVGRSLRRVGECGLRAGADRASGAGGGCCSARRTPPAPPRGGAVR